MKMKILIISTCIMLMFLSIYNAYIDKYDAACFDLLLYYGLSRKLKEDE